MQLFCYPGCRDRIRVFSALCRVFVLSGLILWSGGVFAQTTLSGTVKDNNSGEALAGARVLLPSARAGAMTDDDGRFSFQVSLEPPFTLVVTYFGYDTTRYEVTRTDRPLDITMSQGNTTLEEVEILGSYAQERQKQSPLTVESMSLNAIKETPAANFYDGIGHLKGIDLASASIGFKVINMRGFNAAAPIRSLQIIDGVDNQAPGLNFSLGNFLGASDLDVEAVDLVVGASSAYYGPNAFNGVISMRTKDPFVHKGLSAMVKVGERNLIETAVRYAGVLQNKNGEDKLALKLNAYFLDVNDWVANNYDPVTDARTGRDNPGGYDAVNRYGDEFSLSQMGSTAQVIYPGLKRVFRTGYEEPDLVDYDTRNIKASASLHYKLSRKVEAIFDNRFAAGTTVLQGDNRYSLRDILFFQHRLEVRQRDKFFVRAYMTREDAGNSYDAYFTALRLQERVKSNNQWATEYTNYWAGLSTFNPYYVPPTNGVGGMRGRVRALEGFPPQTFPYDYARADQVLAANADSLFRWHALARRYADNYLFPLIQPGTRAYDSIMQVITRTPIVDGGTRLIDRSALVHLHGEYRWKGMDSDFLPDWLDVTAGANARQYRPYSGGNIFQDTVRYVYETLPDGRQIKVDSTVKWIRNFEYGVYAGAEARAINDRLKINGTLRVDKNQNFRYIPSFAFSGVYTANEKHTFRFGLSAALRNPTLQDQYLGYNVGRAILLGNINGVNNLADTASFRNYLETEVKDSSIVDYFDVAPIQPERVRTLEVGWRANLTKKLYMDAGYYFSWYTDFIGYMIGVDVVFSPVFPDQLIAAQVYRVAANARERVTTQGFSLGLDYFFDEKFKLSGNYSWNVLNTQSDDPIIPAFNTPQHKFNLSFSGRELDFWKIKHAGFAVNYKWVDEVFFEGSPQFTGLIPSYGLVDVQLNKNYPKPKLNFKLGASNVLNNAVFQIYGGPRVGRLAYFAITYGG